MNLNADECAILDALCQGLMKREIMSILRLTSSRLNHRLEDARTKSDSDTTYELVSKYTAWKLEAAFREQGRG